VLTLLGLIALRMSRVQLSLTSDYSLEFLTTTERSEPIPSRDGRILAEDGQILAEDEIVYSLHIHYRWLEEPPDPQWLKSQALHRLDRASRRDAQQVAQALADVEKIRSQLWRRLVVTTGVSLSELDSRRRVIQDRISRRRQKIVERQQQSLAETPSEEPSASGWKRLWSSLVRTLTTPPRREESEPLVIAEQLDYHLLVTELDHERAVEIEGQPDLYPGIRIRATPRRVYPLGEVAAHVIGFRAPASAEFLRNRQTGRRTIDPLDYQPGDRVGISGIERHYERQLRGLRGERRLTLNRRGEVVSERVIREPRYGNDLVVGLSLGLQVESERLLDAALGTRPADPVTGKSLPTPTGGAIVAIDVRSGQILAAASAPRFDPRVLTGADPAGWQRLQSDPRKPLFHRVTEATLPPGSVFKVVSAVALMQEGFIDASDSLTCLGYLDSPERYRCYTFKHHGVGHGQVDIVSALARSCNVFFFAAAQRSGSPPLLDWADRFGLGRATGVDLPGERSGFLPQAISAEDGPLSGRRVGDGETLQLAIGQGRLTATPLQIARLLGSIANGGRLLHPVVASKVGSAFPSETGDDSLGAQSAECIPELSPGILALVRQGLQDVVASPGGTGHKTVFHPQIPIAGKTGTAESGGGRPDHAWFAGYAPANRPRVAFVVVLEHAGTGGQAAGPVARRLVEALSTWGLLGESVPAAGPISAN